MTNRIEITFDADLYNRQREFNESYAKKVNDVLDEFRSVIEDCNDQDIIDFMSKPQKIVARLEDEARQEFQSYIDTLPKSVANSMRFVFDEGDKIMSIHKCLPDSSTYSFIINTCEIKDGECIFDEDKLREKCTVYGDADLAQVWDKALSVAQAINELQGLISARSKSMHAIENLQFGEIGLLRSSEKGYIAEIDRLKLLV